MTDKNDNPLSTNGRGRIYASLPFSHKTRAAYMRPLHGEAQATHLKGSIPTSTKTMMGETGFEEAADRTNRADTGGRPCKKPFLSAFDPIHGGFPIRTRARTGIAGRFPTPCTGRARPGARARPLAPRCLPAARPRGTSTRKRIRLKPARCPQARIRAPNAHLHRVSGPMRPGAAPCSRNSSRPPPARAS